MGGYPAWGLLGRAGRDRFRLQRARTAALSTRHQGCVSAVDRRINPSSALAKYQASILPSWINILDPLLLIASPDTRGTHFHFIVGSGESVPGQESLRSMRSLQSDRGEPAHRGIRSRSAKSARRFAAKPRLSGRTAQPITTGHGRPGAPTHYWRH
jgi:hypothetical protein